ncbi:D-2-hydroxyacid dehydrogenase [Pseudalkalibacillus decolorationis]|uniref:D-2-hydroxyacid dehydrogenase n=1 Tax=Pseudalkalibacillus decolorationis TaxID=163879 RepID=UPI0021487C37|nr:D-2-hydroxyacid dehydrogenase [Pseudalkalibacillus decolorationis]
MYILSSAKIRYSIQDHLKGKYPELQFHFCKNMEEAKGDLAKAEILITYGEDLTPELIEAANHLKWIHVISAGLDKMPFQAIKKQEILVTNAREIHKIPMAEYTIAMMLQVVRNIPLMLESQANRVWNQRIKMDELHGKTLGVLGAGAIGSEVARLAKAFNMKTVGMNSSGKHVEYFDEIVTPKDLDSLLPKVDFLVSVLPKTDSTESFLKKKHFETMQDHAVFINIGRGTTVDEAGLIEALQDNQIAHAVLDVTEEEPLLETSPLWDIKNVTITPHISGITPQYQHRAFEQFEKNLHVYRTNKGNYINVIDLDRGY